MKLLIRFKGRDKKLIITDRHKKGFLAFIAIMAMLSVYLLPTFLFNNLELEFRKQLFLSDQMEYTADKYIELRTSTSDELIFEDKFQEAGKKAELAITGSNEALIKAIEIIEKQKKIPLLPPKYREYNDKKLSLIKERQDLIKDFLRIKINEHKLTNTVIEINLATDNIRNIKNYEDLNGLIYDLYNSTYNISKQNGELYDEDFISQDVYYYIQNENNRLVSFLEELEKVSKSGNWDDFDANNISESSKTNFAQIFEESYNKKREGKFEENQTNYQANTDRLMILSEDYNQNELAFDPLSKLLSNFFSKYPLIKNNHSQPIIVPTDENLDLLS